MINIDNILNNYKENISCKEFDGSYIVAIPFFFLNTCESIAIKISFDEKERPIISDCHTTLDYFEELNIDINNYKEKLDKIMYRYSLELEQRTFKMLVPTTQPYYLTKYLGFFIQALSLIANIDI